MVLGSSPVAVTKLLSFCFFPLTFLMLIYIVDFLVNLAYVFVLLIERLREITNDNEWYNERQRVAMDDHE